MSFDLDELERIHREATPAPWSWATSNSHLRLNGPDGKDGGVAHGRTHPVDGLVDIGISAENMALIEKSRNALPWLLERARQLANFETWRDRKLSPVVTHDALRFAEGTTLVDDKRSPGTLNLARVYLDQHALLLEMWRGDINLTATLRRLFPEGLDQRVNLLEALEQVVTARAQRTLELEAKLARLTREGEEGSDA